MNNSLSRRTRAAALLTAASFLGALSLPAQTLVYEGFDIPAGEIDNTAGATSFGWKKDAFGNEERWWAWNQADNTFNHGVAEEGLEYPGLPTIGGAFEFHEEPLRRNNQMFRLLPRTYTYYSQGHLWMSALFNAKIDGDPSNGGDFQLNLSYPNGHYAVFMGVSYARDRFLWSAGGERLMVDGVRGEKWGHSDIPIEEDVTVFLVLHLDFTTKTAHFYANPPADMEDPGEPIVSFTMWEDLFIDRVMLWMSNNGPSRGEPNPETLAGMGADYTGSRVDEIRLGSTYWSVAGGAELEGPDPGPIDTDPPLITGPSGEEGDATSEGTVTEGKVKVTDMKANEDVVWTITGGADGDFFSIGAGTGGLSFKTPPVFGERIDADADGVYVVEVTATDPAGNKTVQTISVTVLERFWAGQLKITDGWIHTDANYFGWMTIDSEPWLYNLAHGGFIYLPEESYSESGAWAYFADFGEIYQEGDSKWYWHGPLITWVYIPYHDEGPAGWVYVMNIDL